MTKARIHLVHDGAALVGWRWGDASTGRRPLVMLHGFTGDGQDFEPLAQALGRSLRCPALAPDLIGHGQSASPEGVSRYHIERCADDVVRWADAALGEGCRPVLMGYSMGGRTALTAAVRSPERWSRLVLIGATPGLASASARADRVARDASLADEIEAGGVPSFLRRWQQVPIIATQRRVEASIREAMLARRGAASARGWANSLRGMGTGAMPPLWDRLAEVRCPTLLVTGAEDVKFEGIALDMLERLPEAAHVRVEGAGHAAHLEQGARAGALISSWLRCGSSARDLQ